MSAVLPNPPLPAVWRRGLWPFIGVLIAVLLVYRQTAEAMVAIWMRSETYAHAFVVPPIVLWLVWRKRAELRQIAPRPAPWMLLPIAAAALLWLLGDLVVANAITQLAFTAMLVMAVPALLGWAVTRALLFPLAFLFFAVPMGEALTPWLMQWTADFTVMAVRASGVPLYREGMQFVIPTGTWSVVEACSGVRYLMASFMVGSLFAYLNYQSTSRRILFGLVSLALPIVANWLRAYMIVMLGHLSNNAIATGADHILYGWVFFGIVIIGMFFIGARWAEPDPELPAAVPTAAGAGALSPAVWPVAAAIVALLLLPPWAVQRLGRGQPGATPVLAMPALLAPGWAAADEAVSTWQPAFGEASASAVQAYRNGDALVGVHVAYYRAQTDSRKLVNAYNVLVSSTDHAWNLLPPGQRQLSLPDGALLPLRTAQILAADVPGRAERPRLRVWRLYWVGGQVTTSDVMAKLYSIWQQLSGQGDESASLIFYARDDEAGGAESTLEAFTRANFRKLDSWLRGVAHAR